ncbi:MAG: hypothetical protein IPQ02_15115 [Saprospiraceae bacterium]|nr:hypothetical protein [Candidatus Defluviibacterium haderslevense]
MNIGKINIDITKATSCRDNLIDPNLKLILSKYCDSLGLVITTLAVPISFMAHGLRKSKAFHFSLQDADKVLMASDGFAENDPKKSAEELVSYFENLIKTSHEKVVENAIEEIELLVANVPILQESYNNLGLNTLVNCWTLFEAISKDIWIYSLNNFPKEFVFNLLKNRRDFDQEIEGITGKNISIGLLAKYDFDISKNIGDLLVSKYDFTTVRGIKNSYKDLFELKDADLAMLADKNLTQLEITRHLFVHNAGIIDSDYLKRSAKQDEIINTKIKLTSNEASDLINASIKGIHELACLIENKINKGLI